MHTDPKGDGSQFRDRRNGFKMGPACMMSDFQIALRRVLLSLRAADPGGDIDSRGNDLEEAKPAAACEGPGAMNTARAQGSSI